MPGTYISPAETGFYYLQSRYYDPANCRFINADVFISTGQGFVGHNMFAYCNNNPVVYVDNKGELGEAAFIGSYTGIAPMIETIEMIATLDDLGFSDTSWSTAHDCVRTLKESGIDTAQEMAHFFSQCYVESKLSILEAGWLSYEAAEAYRTQQDYYPYYGAGYIQLTWEYNYRAFSEAMGDPCILSEGPQYVAEHYAWSAAGWFWRANSINDLIAQGASVADVTQVVNGGLSAYEERLSLYQQYIKYFGG